MAHTPLYSSSDGHTGRNKALRESIEGLLYQYNVSLGIWGDDHGYERSYPVFDGIPDKAFKMVNKVPTFQNPTKPIHLLSGTAGVGLDGWKDAPTWSAFREAVHGYTKIEISRTTLKGRFIRQDGSIADEFAIVQPGKAGSKSESASLWWYLPVAGVLAFFGYKRRQLFFYKYQHCNEDDMTLIFSEKYPSAQPQITGNRKI